MGQLGSKIAKVLVWGLFGACAEAPPSTVKEAHPPSTRQEGGGVHCTVRSRTLSAKGRGAVHPSVASNGQGYAVVWEESSPAHSAVHLQSLDGEGALLGPAVELVSLSHPGAEPLIAADGDGYAIGWAEDQDTHSILYVRRVDRRGKPLSDAVPVVSSVSARPLALARAPGRGPGRYALVWWSWATETPEQWVSWLDESGQPIGKPRLMVHGNLVEPAVAITDVDGALRVTWVESVAGTDHVYSAALGPGGIEGRIEIGPGSEPWPVRGGVVFSNLADSTVHRARLARADQAAEKGAVLPPILQVGEGQSATAGERVVCLFRQRTTEDRTFDELRCLELGEERVARDQRIAEVPGGVLTLRVAPLGKEAPTYGVAYQTEEDGGMAVTFAAVRCPGLKDRGW